MVLVRSESGQLLMFPQQALAQMQAQAQGDLAPRATTPTNVPPGQVRTTFFENNYRSLHISDSGHVQPAHS